MSPTELLEERISDIVLSRKVDPKILQAVIDAAAIAIPCVLRAGLAGNVQCQEATQKLQPFLSQLK